MVDSLKYTTTSDKKKFYRVEQISNFLREIFGDKGNVRASTEFRSERQFQHLQIF